jgi:hypothetical protein
MEGRQHMCVCVCVCKNTHITCFSLAVSAPRAIRAWRGASTLSIPEVYTGVKKDLVLTQKRPTKGMEGRRHV